MLRVLEQSQQQGEQNTQRLQQQMNNIEELINTTKSVKNKQEQNMEVRAEFLYKNLRNEKKSWWRRLLRKFFLRS